MERPLSATNIFLIVAAIVVAFLVSVAVLPAKHLWQRMTQPVLVAPAISGTAKHHGKPVAGLQVRRALLSAHSKWDCASLPVVAESNAAGAFHVAALYKPHFRLPPKDIVLATCFMHRGERIDSSISFPLLGYQSYSWVLVKCDWPLPVATTYPEDHNCMVFDSKKVSYENAQYAN